jgi:seryl-tRNA synthetase
MAKKNQLSRAAKKIGAAIGRADRTAHKVARAGMVAREELVQLSKQVESLKRQLQKTTKRLKNALT